MDLKPTLPEAELDEIAQVDPVKFPKDVKKVLALLDEYRALPVTTRSEQQARQTKIDRLSQHLHEIQQGPPTPVVTSQNTSRISGAQNDMARKMLVDQLGQQWPIVRELSDQNEKLSTENEALKAELAKLSPKQ